MSEENRGRAVEVVGFEYRNEFLNGVVSVRSSMNKSELDKFCSALGGKKPIHSILIANNGMAAVKFMRSIRTWACETFGTEKAILLVAMATPEDMRINAEHIRIADQFVEVPGGTNNNNYANVQLIVEMAEMTHVDAVWPGWGHASENPELPDALNAKGVVFLGPAGKSMAALGDKIGSSLIAQSANVPTLPWSGSHVKIVSEACLLTIPDDIYNEACVHTAEEAISSCLVVGYPAMIKASWGGGGKGIRKVHNDDEVRSLFKQVQGEVPGSPIFTMKVASQSRHLEVQLLCDQYGNVAALHSRDCSVQRRHQKIIEEGPITVTSMGIIRELEQAARRLAKSVNYVGAATVEYLYSMDTGEYYFLELNPRLQVEHPVTEWIAEINLPAAQVAVGMGIPLWKIPEIRRCYGMEYGGGYDTWRATSMVSFPFDFDKVEPVRPKGHCVAVRVTSEDPDDGFKPTSGRVQELSFKSKPNVWAYFSVKSGGGIHEFSDSQFGHVFAFGESRALAIANMVLGLKEVQIRGEIHTNVDYTIDLLHASDYRENKIHTGWLDSRIAMRVRAERPPWYFSVVGGALFKASASSAALVSDYVGYLEKGQIPPKHISLVNSQVSLNIEGSKYTINMVRGASGSYRLKMNKSEVEAEIHTLRDGGLLMQLDGESHVIYAEEEAAGTRLLIDGRTCLLHNDHDPSKLVAETPCKLMRYLVADGNHIDSDSPYAEVEVMKMCMPLLSPAAGAIRFHMPEGQAMQTGELIAVLDLDDPSTVRKAEPFLGMFPLLGPPAAVSGKVHQRCLASINAARMILAGYEHDIDEVVYNLINCLDNPELPFLQWQECVAVLSTRLPKGLWIELESKYKQFECTLKSQNPDFPAKSLRNILEAHLLSYTDKEKGGQERLVEPLMCVVKSYEGGREGHAHTIVHSLFEQYLLVEELFSDAIEADVIEQLRLRHKKDLLKVVDIVLSHQGIRSKNKLILRLMEQLVYPSPAAYRDKLIRFSQLSHINYSELALKASQLLEQTKLSELRSTIARNLSELEMFTEDGEHVDTPRKRSAISERMEDLVTAPFAVEDALVSLFDHSDHTLQRRVVEAYVCRLYQPYLVKGSIRMQWHRSGLIASWEFMEEYIEKRNGQENEMWKKQFVEKHSERKWGAMVIIKSLHFLPAIIAAALREAMKGHHRDIPEDSKGSARFGNMMHIVLVGINNQMSLLQDSGDEYQARERISKLEKIIRGHEVGPHLGNADVKVISCIIVRDDGRGPMRHSFNWSEEKQSYEEDPALRHLEPPLAIYLELNKLDGHENIQYTPSRDRQWHLYTLVERERPVPTRRMFLRTLVRQPTSNGCGLAPAHFLRPESADMTPCPSFTSTSISNSITSAMEELELYAHNAALKPDHAHMYLCVLRAQRIADLVAEHKRVNLAEELQEAVVEAILEELAMEIHSAMGTRMHKLGVCEWEVKLWIDSLGRANGAWRIVVTNVTGHTCIVHTYRELEDGITRMAMYQSLSTHGPLHGESVNARYRPLGALDRKRLLARKSNTTYCYDFPLAFEMALRRTWASRCAADDEYSKSKDRVYLRVTELVVADQKAGRGTPVIFVDRQAGLNDVGMVAWRMVMSTPEFPSGRMIVVIANDVTFKAGSFGPREDTFFLAITDLACSSGLPLIYLAANSGARIGVAEEIKSCFRVGWSDEQCPESGFQYVYLTPEDYARVGIHVVAHELRPAVGESRWVIDAVVGKEDGLGVENLSGSGAMASAFSRAYKEIFTLTYVTSRTVGIGAYLARLGMRCIQRLDQPIILTGFSALNKLLGREVYSSHMQLGGPKIMATNGVVHLTVADDLEGVSAILKWLSFVPSRAGGPLPVSASPDPPQRRVEYTPENFCDPRAAICGCSDGSGKWLGGIFDRGSFVETLEGWARTVVTGRAKLGGIPVGVIAVETQTVIQVVPADPGQLDSQERVVSQAGQVWFPDSASKTAQAILDFSHEGLPLFILANWRGFSGGQRDLFDGILQAGSTIVENLRTYGKPVFVYIPMMGELRGGAWVVVDSQINPSRIEMYADRTARGNVLEPEGMIEIKFRARELLECMGRLDQQLISMKHRLADSRTGGAPAFTVEPLEQQVKSREKQLLPLYTQIATKFAELHDTSSRMAAKGVIKEVVDWAGSRLFFYTRLSRRIAEYSLIDAVKDAHGAELSHQSAMDLLKRWFSESAHAQQGRGDGDDAWDDDVSFFAWKGDPNNYQGKLQELRLQKAFRHLTDLCKSSSDFKPLPHLLASLLSQVDPAARETLVDEIREVLH